MARILAIHSCESDALTQLSGQWLAIVRPQFIPETLLGPKASRQFNANFQNTVEDPTVVLVTGLAHGKDDAFTGWGGEILYSAQGSPGVPGVEVAGKIFHFLSCSAAQMLGQAFTIVGCRAFIGYSAVVEIDQTGTAATTILTCDAQVDMELANGNSVAGALQKAKDSYTVAGMKLQGDLLTFYGDDDSITLPPVSTGISPAALAMRTTPTHSLVAANSIPNRTTPTASAVLD